MGLRSLVSEIVRLKHEFADPWSNNYKGSPRLSSFFREQGAVPLNVWDQPCLAMRCPRQSDSTLQVVKAMSLDLTCLFLPSLSRNVDGKNVLEVYYL
jgi:hypothetical protein